MNYILFICGHNAGRSQMAQAFFNNEKKKYPTLDSSYEAISVGTRPADKINPTVIAVMKETGIDMNNVLAYFPKPLDSEFIASRGNTITRAIIACDDSCILPKGLPKIKLEKWSLPDPNQQPAKIVRKVRDAVKAKVIELFKELSLSSEQ